VKAKAAARFNGRRGGRFAEESAGKFQILIHQDRLRELAKGPVEGRWPAASLSEWAEIARAAAEREGVSPSPREAMALDVMDAAKAGGWAIPTTTGARK
jgi:hypothetical protein